MKSHYVYYSAATEPDCNIISHTTMTMFADSTNVRDYCVCTEESNWKNIEKTGQDGMEEGEVG